MAQEHDNHEKHWSMLLSSKTRVQIFGLLSIYQEMTLGELSHKLHKSKSTVHEHLKALLEGGAVEVVREVSSRSNIATKIYRLIPELQEDTEICETTEEILNQKVEFNEKYAPDALRRRIKGLYAFAQYHQRLLDLWTQYLEDLEEMFVEGKGEEAAQVFAEMDQTQLNPVHTISFYSQDLNAELHKDFKTLYHALECSEKEIQDQERRPKPIFVGYTIIPIRFIMNYLSEKAHREKNRNPK